MSDISDNNTKRVSISKRLKRLIVFTSLFSMVAIAVIAQVMMYRIRGRSEEHILKSIENNVMNSLDDTAVFIEAELNEYMNQVEESVTFAENLYREPDKYLPREMKGHQHVTERNYCFHRYFVNEEYSKKDLSSEINLLNNIGSFWIPILVHDNENITSIYLGTETGFFLSYDKEHIEDVTNEEGEEYFDYLSRPWYIAAKFEKRTIFTNIEEDYFGRGAMLTCASPFYKDGEIAGVIAIDILVKDIQSNIIAIDVGEGGYTFAVNKQGMIVASSGEDASLSESNNIRDKKNEMSVIANNVLSGNDGIDAVNESYYAYSPIKNVDWILCAKIPKSLIRGQIKGLDKSIKRLMENFAVAALIILVIVFLLSNSFSTKIIEPIQQLIKDVNKISNGDLDYKAKVIGNNEISDLATSFNQMTGSLKHYVNDITKLTAEKERAGAELSIATNIQAAMLPSNFPAFPEDNRFDIFATMHPAKEVGGDFYDFFKVDERHIAIVVADVSGKGVPASLFMAIGKTLIKDHSNIQPSLSAVFYTVNNILCESNKENLFITAFEGLINLETGLMTYVNAGHELPFVYKKGKGWESQQIKPCFILAGMENMKYTTGEIQLEPGDKIFQYTDGVTEATNIKNELYGMERLNAALNMNGDKSMKDLLPSIKSDIDKFVGEAPQFDDITMLGFHFRPNG